jgi:glutamate dehydrogenase (NAD(P)+)
MEATGRGVFIVTRETRKHMGKGLEGATVAVQGFGNVGSITARLLHEAGCKVVALSDVFGAIYNKNGIDVKKALRYVQEHGKLTDLPGTEPIDGKALLELPMDILVPAALEGQLTGANADQVKAKLIIEAANGPTSTEADAIFHDRGIPVVPDILANAGGVTVSYFEWVQDLQHFFWEEDEINQRLERIMVRSFNAVQAKKDEQNCDYRMGAYLLAVARVAEATQVRGIYP